MTTTEKIAADVDAWLNNPKNKVTHIPTGVSGVLPEKAGRQKKAAAVRRQFALETAQRQARLERKS